MEELEVVGEEVEGVGEERTPGPVESGPRAVRSLGAPQRNRTGTPSPKVGPVLATPPPVEEELEDYVE